MNRFVSVRVKCASCGEQFGEANHRFVLHDATRGHTVSMASGAAADSPIYTVRPFIPSTLLDSAHDYPACGESCLQKLESQLLSGKKL
jgi:hypothetical protein